MGFKGASQDRSHIHFLTDTAPIPYKTFCQDPFGSCALSTTIRSPPYLLAKLWVELDDRALRQKFGMSCSGLSYMTKSKTFSDRKIRSQLGYPEQVSRGEGLRDLASWAKSVGGPEKIVNGRRRGEERELAERTFSFLMNDSKLLAA